MNFVSHGNCKKLQQQCKAQSISENRMSGKSIDSGCVNSSNAILKCWFFNKLHDLKRSYWAHVNTLPSMVIWNVNDMWVGHRRETFHQRLLLPKEQNRNHDNCLISRWSSIDAVQRFHSTDVYYEQQNAWITDDVIRAVEKFSSWTFFFLAGCKVNSFHESTITTPKWILVVQSSF
jgi:hypothetical protein